MYLHEFKFRPGERVRLHEPDAARALPAAGTVVAVELRAQGNFVSVRWDDRSTVEREGNLVRCL